MITNEAVEAAARAFMIGAWGRYDPEEVPRILNAVREALEAAAPHMLKDLRPLTEVEKANRDHPERMTAARKKLQEGARAWRRIERKQVEAKALMDAAKRLQQDNPANAVVWLRDQGRTIGIAARQEAEVMDDNA